MGISGGGFKLDRDSVRVFVFSIFVRAGGDKNWHCSSRWEDRRRMTDERGLSDPIPTFADQDECIALC